MLNFVRRMHAHRLGKKWNRGVGAFESLLNDAIPVGLARPLLEPKMFRVTAQNPYRGPYMEDDMVPARQPDGRLLETYMIDGFAIDGLWLGFDELECGLYLAQQKLVKNGRFMHPMQSLPVYEFTVEMAEILQKASPTQEPFHTYVYCVEHADDHRPLTREDFGNFYRWDTPKVVPTSVPVKVETSTPPLRLAA